MTKIHCGYCFKGILKAKKGGRIFLRLRKDVLPLGGKKRLR
jgi:hypothetical protein